MSAKGLSSRAIIGSFYKTLSQDEGQSWIGGLSMLFTSDQDSEEYKWLGQTAAMREWVGGRNAKGFRENGLTITNKHYEATIEVLVKELRRDKTGQVMVRINEMAQRANAHWMSLLSTLILNGTSAVCYDGQFFFDDDHSEGDSGTQSNDITTDISALPVNTAEVGTPTNPAIAEAQQSVMKSIAQIKSFVDDQGEPMNEMASNFLVMVPTALYVPFTTAFARVSPDLNTHILPPSLNISVVENARLTGTDDFYTFRTDGSVSPFIRQQETGVQLKAKAEGSEFEFDNDAHQYGIDTWRNVGYGYWQHAVYNQMV